MWLLLATEARGDGDTWGCVTVARLKLAKGCPVSRAASTQLEVFEAPYLGIDTESAPTRLSKGYASSAANVLTGKPGRLPIRGDIVKVSSQVWPTPTDSAIWMEDTGLVLVSDRASTGKANPNPGTNGVGTLNTFSTFDLSPVGGALGDVRVSTGVNNIFGFSKTGVFTWIFVTGVHAYTNAPSGGRAITYYLNRLWVLGGKPPGGTTDFKDHLYWSDLFAAIPPSIAQNLPDTVAAWSDDVSGLVNQIVLPSVGVNGNDPVGFGRLPNALVAFGKRGADILLGSTPSTLTVRPNVVTHGCVDSRSIIEYNGTIIWAAKEGVYSYDGAAEVELSPQIRGELQRLMLTTAGVNAVRLPNDYLLFNYVNSAHVATSYLLHLPTRSWSRVTLPGGIYVAVSAPGTVYDGQTVTALGWNGQRFWVLDTMTSQDLVTASGRDIAADGSTHLPFMAHATSRLSLLGEPSARTVIGRATVQSSCWAASDLWRMRLEANNYDVIRDWVPLTAKPANTPPSRDIVEVNAEANELQIRAEFNGDAAVAVQNWPELNDSFVEYTPAQQTSSY